ncbi:MFS transporter [Bifidobacterium bombi]|uniref:MFS superfamily transporter n=1 Tax=Bifidobacterium bombi DSM 19703 TaxID=1341695 RepID=A0A080N208_9BIFI|nr:MFS transporter [Bifidobacterium bombi]KFF30938.1 MFS superfamily transporter [Bifidobacterium bombi DSM 19703]
MNIILKYLGMSRKNFGIFLVITFSTCIYWWSGIKSVIYEPFRKALGVSNTQLGFLLGLIGFVQIFGYLLLGWIQDLVSIRDLIFMDLWGYGIFALILGLVPNLPYWFLIVAFMAFGLFGDAIYWPTVQKTTKGVASETTQAATFSTQEAIRSIMGLIITPTTLALFTIAGSHVSSARVPMIAYPIFMMLFSFVVLRFIPKDFMHEKDVRTSNADKPKTRNGFLMIVKAMKLPVVWTTGFGAFVAYLIYVATSTYFLPFVQASFHLSDTAAGLFGIVNSGLMGVIAALFSGILSTTRFKTSPQWMALLYAIIGCMCLLITVVPHTPAMMFPVVIICCLTTFVCVAIRAVYYAPIGEYGVPSDISATAMSIASFIGYCPAFFGYMMFGAIIDGFRTQTAYRIIFLLLAAMSVAGIVICLLGHGVIMSKRKRDAAVTQPIGE